MDCFSVSSSWRKKFTSRIAGNDKRLKNAEILLSKTSFRLNEMLHSSDYDDRSLVEADLGQGEPGAE